MKQIVILASVELGVCNAPAIHILSVAKKLSSIGYEIKLIAPKPKGELPIEIMPSEFSVEYTPDLTRIGLMNSFNSLVQFAAIWRHRKTQVIYLRSSPFSFFLCIAARLFGYRKLIIETNGWMLDEVEQIGYSKWLARFFGWLQVKEAQKADKIRVVTKGLKDLFVENKIDEKRIVIIGNGSDMQQFCLLDKRKCRKQLKLKQERIYFIFVGNLWPANDLKTMFSAIAILREQGMDAHCLVLGEGISSNKFKEDAKRAAVDDFCLFTGMVTPEKVNEYLNAADVAILPSDVTYYGKVGRSPLKMGNYLATGKPVVATSLPGIDLLKNQEWLFICPASDPEKMAQQMNKAYSKMSPQLAKQARSYAEANYSWHEIARKIGTLF